MRKSGVLAAIIGLSIVAAVGTAQAAETPLSKIGMSAMIGGGVVGFTDADAVDMTNAGGSWTARLGIGTRFPLTLEAAYIGTAQGIDALNLDTNALLMSNGIEADLRLNFLNGAWQPYAFVGAGWKQYRIINADFNTSSVADKDNVAEIPVGGGLAYVYENLIVDLRLSFNPSFDNELIAAAKGGYLQLNNWNTNLRVGFEF